MQFPLAMGYAETHYKFKLPWSPLHEAWPEIFLDAPSRLEPGQDWPVWLVVRDADLFAVLIHSITVSILAEGFPPLEIKLPLAQRFTEPFHFFRLNVPLSGRKGMVTVHAVIDAQRVGKKLPRKPHKLIHDWNYPGLAPMPLQVQVLEHPYPKPQGWWAGETHCHTWHSSDPVEFGAPAHILQTAARALGLDYVQTTDHSYDFSFRQDNYRIAADPLTRWQAACAEVAALPAHPLMIPGEEVSCGNSRGQNVHLLVAGHPEYIPGLGDSGRNWFHNRPDLSIGEVLDQAKTVPCFAAHPQYPIRWLERKVFRRGPYHAEDLFLEGPNPIAGLEFWNGSLDAGFHAGRKFWISQLLQGAHLLPIGGNDAHGDLNRFCGVKTPLFSLFSSRSRIFGKVRTVLNNAAQDQLVLATLHASFRAAQQSGQLYITDGPSLHMQLNMPNLVLTADSTSDFGVLTEVILFWGDLKDRCEVQEILHPNQTNYCTVFSLKSQCAYVRAECRTQFGNFALSAPVWYNL